MFQLDFGVVEITSNEIEAPIMILFNVMHNLVPHIFDVSLTIVSMLILLHNELFLLVYKVKRFAIAGKFDLDGFCKAIWKVERHYFIRLISYEFGPNFIDVQIFQHLDLVLVFLFECHEAFVVSFAVVWNEKDVENLFKCILVDVWEAASLSFNIEHKETRLTKADHIPRILIILYLLYTL